MKKFFLLLSIAVLSIACTSIEDKTRDNCDAIIAALNDRNWDKADDLIDEFFDWYDDLSLEDQDTVEQIVRSYDNYKLLATLGFASVEDKANKYAERAEKLKKQIFAAYEAEDDKKAEELENEFEKLTKEYEEWYKSLPEWDKKAVMKVAVKVKLTVEQQAKDYFKQSADLMKQVEKAYEAGDEKKTAELEKKTIKLVKEYDEWYRDLSEKDKVKAEKAMAEAAEAMGF